MKKYKWLLFDADGTLFDYDKAEAKALQQSIEQIGYQYHRKYLAQYRQVNKQVWDEFEQGKLAQDVLKVKRFELFFEGMKIDSQPEQFSQRYLGNLAQGDDLIEGAEETLKALSTRYRLAIITNGLKEVQRSRLEKSKIRGYIEEIIISDEIGVAKPEAEIFEVAFAAMGNPRKEETLMIGDSLKTDIAGGYNYGIDTCWYNPQKQEREKGLRVTYEISKLAELRDLLAV